MHKTLSTSFLVLLLGLPLTAQARVDDAPGSGLRQVQHQVRQRQVRQRQLRRQGTWTYVEQLRCVVVRRGPLLQRRCRVVRAGRPAWIVDPAQLRAEIPRGLTFDEIPDGGEVGTPPWPAGGPPAIVLPRRDDTPAIVPPRRDDAPAIVLPRRDDAPAIVLPPRIVPSAPLRVLPPPYRPEPAARPMPPPTSSRPGSTTVELTAREAQAWRLLNLERKRRGLAALRVDPRATIAARSHSADMCIRRYFSHQSPEGSAPWGRLRKAGVRFTAAAENIAVGYASAQGVHDGWMRSAGHRNNRLNGRYGRVGIGVYDCNGRPTWTEVFMN